MYEAGARDRERRQTDRQRFQKLHVDPEIVLESPDKALRWQWSAAITRSNQPAIKRVAMLHLI